MYIVQGICIKDLKPYIEITPTEDWGVVGFCFLERNRRKEDKGHFKKWGIAMRKC